MSTTVLCVDEFGFTRFELTNMLKSSNINFMGVKNEIELVNILHDKSITVNAVVWAVSTSNSDCFDSIRRIKAKEEYKNLPFVIISTYTDKRYIIKAIEAGAVEFIVKPYDEKTVAKKMFRILGISSDKVPERNIDEDIITFNFSEMFNKEIKAASRGLYPLGVILLYVTYENAEAEVYQQTGEVITTINKVLRTKLRDTDSSFQYGNSNLLVLLPFADREGIAVVENKIKNLFNNHSVIKQKNIGYRLDMVSVCFPGDGKIKDRLLEKLEGRYNEKRRQPNNSEDDLQE